jgi:hypothetical protein
MAKDPAFLFYSSDFLTGTAFMTDEETGQYIKLLCLQHQHGHMDISAMHRYCHGNAAASILSKFSIDNNGKYFNERLDIEIDKRKKHCDHQREKAVKRWQCHGNATAMPLENENENENRNEDVIGIEIKKEIVKRKQFEKPTIQEISDYCKERKNNIDAEKFYSYYESNGWMIGGKAKMKNWKAAVITWEKNNFNNGKPQQKKMEFEKNIEGKYANVKMEVHNVN